MARNQGDKVSSCEPSRYTDPTGCKFFELGLMCATNAAPTDRVSAHKWFNLAALYGNKHASLRRIEIAAEMSDDGISAAQSAARDWLATH